VADKTFYITTPIYYPSNRLHIGHAYTTVYCDALARWHRFKGEDVFFLTGSDEHGQKIERAAQESGKTPERYVEEIVATFKELWQRLNISYDDFIRTTEKRHHQVVQEIFRRLYEKGDIYKSTYKGWYCTPCETFWTESKLVDGCCPDCDRPVEMVAEESYFFRMSKYARPLLDHIAAHPEFIQPATRRNEMIAFINQGLEDLCVSRTTFNWGIPVPFDERHVIYVWIDALTNYLTAIGYLADEDKFGRYWPADVHVVGKDILRFHTIIWPTILMAAGLPLPRQVYGHGWVLVKSGKMSKSKGNVVDPLALIEQFGADAVRYFLLREMSFGQDAKYSKRALMERINSDLANDLGNAFHRTQTMLARFCRGQVPAPDPVSSREPIDADLINLAAAVVENTDRALTELDPNAALIEIWRLVGAVNKYIDQTEPWSLAKDPAKSGRLREVMYNVCEALRITALLVAPFLPETGKALWRRLGLSDLDGQRFADLKWGGMAPGVEIGRGEPLFPRLDIDKILAEDESGDEEDETAAEAGEKAAAGKDQQQEEKQDMSQEPTSEELISIDEFAKVKLRLAKVESVAPVPGADKLLALQVDMGGEKRQIVAGIAKYYQPEELVGKTIVVVANLKPARLRGMLSQGMLLAAEDQEGKLGVITVDRDIAPGAVVR